MPIPQDLPPRIADPGVADPSAGGEPAQEPPDLPDQEEPAPAESEPDPDKDDDDDDDKATEADEEDADDKGEADDEDGKDAQAARPGTVEPDQPAAELIAPTDGVTYEARIQILDAYQYPGGLSKAPGWVDRNWTAYADPDELRQIPAGPCLRVPLPSGLTAICRIGDYVCRQSVTLAPGLRPEIRLEVWDQEQFQKLFVVLRKDATLNQADRQLRSSLRRSRARQASSPVA